MRPTQPLEWQSDDLLSVDGAHFLVSADDAVYRRRKSDANRFVLAKRPVMVERLAATARELDVERIVELGIYQGGSTAFLASVFRPVRLTALELDPEPVQALQDFIDRRGLLESIRPRYGFDQSDVGALRAVVADDHGESPLDLVVDDASHFYRETRASFGVLFPRLRPGGVYVIEDWAWSHVPRVVRDHAAYFRGRPALTNLVIELLMALGSASGLISEIRVHQETVEIVRGPRSHEGAVRLEEEYFNRGLPFRPLL